MKRYFVFFSFFFLINNSCKQAPKEVHFYKYDSQLFKDVQLNGLFKDSKKFTDLVPIMPYNLLENKYLETKDDPGFDLSLFVEEHFEDHSMATLEIKSDTTISMYEHIDAMWEKLKRGPDPTVSNSSRINLPHPYVVPGGRFQEIYYWDSYFTLEGLIASGRWDMAKSMTDNFAFLIDSLGFIPNGTRDYYETRSQPPFFTSMVKALEKSKPGMSLYFLPEINKEYDYFMQHDTIDRPYGASNHVVQLIGGGHLNRYYDRSLAPRPEAYKEDVHLAEGKTDQDKMELYQHLRSAAESGWDFSTRWFGQKEDFSSIKTADIIPIDLNCLLHNTEIVLSQVYMKKGDQKAAQYFRNAASQRLKLINEYLWDEEVGFYKDFDFRRAEKMPYLTLAGAYPMFFRVASGAQGEKIKNVLMDQFLRPGGLVTTLNHSGQQWDAPNGWAPLQWIAVIGLLNYGYNDEAKLIMERWLYLNEKVYKSTGKMMEKYNVEDLSLLSGGGEYETQDGFGWTNGIAVSFRQILDQMEKEGAD